MAKVAQPKRGRRSKAEIQEEFEGIVEEERQSSSSVKESALLSAHEKELIDSVKDVSSEEMVRKFADLQIEIAKMLGNLSEKIVGEIQNLIKIREVISLEKKELSNLHKTDIALTALDGLIESYELKRTEFEEEIETGRAAWEAEKEKTEAQTKEYAENLLKTRKREAEEFEYKRNLERSKAQDKYEAELSQRDKQNREKQEALEKTWKLREEALKIQEEEVISLRKMAESFSSKLKEETDKAVAETERKVAQKLQQEIVVLKKDIETEKRLSDLKIKTLEETVARQLQQITLMQTQVDEAKKQVQDIAVKAIEGASGAKALSHINQIAIEQAKGRPNQVNH
jgi:hypothetical protein